MKIKCCQCTKCGKSTDTQNDKRNDSFVSFVITKPTCKDPWGRGTIQDQKSHHKSQQISKNHSKILFFSIFFHRKGTLTLTPGMGGKSPKSQKDPQKKQNKDIIYKKKYVFKKYISHTINMFYLYILYVFKKCKVLYYFLYATSNYNIN